MQTPPLATYGRGFRIFPRLVVSQQKPIFEYSNLNMKEALGVEEWNDIAGEMMAEYLEIYTKKFGLLEHCRFGTEAMRVEREGADGKGL